jgi:hypothetical protein
VIFHKVKRNREPLISYVPNFLTMELVPAYKDAYKLDQINIVKMGFTTSKQVAFSEVTGQFSEVFQSCIDP